MDRIKKNFGFGAMRLPIKDGEVDIAQTCRMVDAFLDAGFNYFDTAHGYLDGKSEPTLRECLTSRYPRERYVLTTKLSGYLFQTEADIRPLFQSQLKACGVDYFDFYLMHAQSAKSFEKFKQCRAYETALALKAEGKVRHMGISFHDRAEVLEQILTEYPQIEVVQIQFNYADYDDPKVEGRRCYEVCRKFGKPVIVMEPVKGGNLVNLPEPALEVFRALGGGSPASYAIRFAAGSGFRSSASAVRPRNTAASFQVRGLEAEKVPSAPPLAMPCSLAQAMAGRYHSMPKLSLKGSSSPISTSGLPAAS